MKNWILVLSVALGLAGCGDDASPMDSGADGATPDGGMDAGDLDAGPTDAGDLDAAPTDAGDLDATTADAGPVGCVPSQVLAITSDYIAGAEGTLFDPMMGSSMSLGMLADQDTAPAFAGCRAYLLERSIGHLIALDGVTTTVDVDLNESGVTDPYAANPQAVIAISDTEIWVPLSGRNVIVRVDPTLGAASAVLGELDLSAYVDAADTDGLVEPTSALVLGDRVYLGLSRYYFDASYGIHFDAGSLIAVFDVGTAAPIDMDDSVTGIQGIPVGDNPWRGMAYDADSNQLWVGAAGDSFALDGAIEAIDLATGASAGALLTETTLGAELNGFAAVSPTRVYVLAGTDVVLWDSVTGAMPAAVVASNVSGMLLMGDTLFTWSRMGEGVGLHSFDAATGVETTPAAGATSFGAMPIAALAPVP